MKPDNPSLLHGPAWILALSALVLALAWPVPADAQWKVIQLHPGGASGSTAYGVRDGKQVGVATVNGVQHACMWSGSASSWVDLHPPGADRSEARGVAGDQQMGWARVGGVPRASLWSGGATSWVDLTPFWAGATRSAGGGVRAGQQVGGAVVDGVNRASLWTGTAASWTDLHPLGATISSINDTDGTQQVGHATVGGTWRASLWQGSAASWRDLTPAGAWSSYATAVGDGQQVGYTWFDDAANTPSRASLWRGTAASWVNLSPAGQSNWSSMAYGVHGGQQVGEIGFRAALWTGTADSYVDLNAFLPRDFGSPSVAFGIWHDETHVYVVGRAYNTRTARQEAVMWRARYTPPAAPGITVAPTGGLTTSEDGGQDSFTVVLNTAPAADVTIGIASSDTSEATVSALSLTFTPGNWNVPQTVTVTGQDDALLDGNIAYTVITGEAISADLDYSGLNAADVSGTNLDNESPPPVTVTAIDPTSMDAGSTVGVTLTGSGFAPGATVVFENGSGPPPTATNVVVSGGGTTITASVSVSKGGPQGTRVWDVRVTNPDTASGVLVDGFRVVK